MSLQRQRQKKLFMDRTRLGEADIEQILLPIFYRLDDDWYFN